MRYFILESTLLPSLFEGDSVDGDNNDSTLNKKLSQARQRIRELEQERSEYLAAKRLEEVCPCAKLLTSIQI